MAEEEELEGIEAEEEELEVEVEVDVVKDAEERLVVKFEVMSGVHVESIRRDTKEGATDKGTGVAPTGGREVCRLAGNSTRLARGSRDESSGLPWPGSDWWKRKDRMDERNDLIWLFAWWVMHDKWCS